MLRCSLSLTERYFAYTNYNNSYWVPVLDLLKPMDTFEANNIITVVLNTRISYSISVCFTCMGKKYPLKFGSCRFPHPQENLLFLDLCYAVFMGLFLFGRMYSKCSLGLLKFALWVHIPNSMLHVSIHLHWSTHSRWSQLVRASSHNLHGNWLLYVYTSIKWLQWNMSSNEEEGSWCTYSLAEINRGGKSQHKF